MSNPFQKAVREQIKLRLLLTGPTGAGKSFTALSIASAFGKVAAMDTENRSLSRYANRFEFDVLPAQPPYNPHQVVNAIKLAKLHGYDALVIDSLYHFWKEEGGVLDIVEKAGKKFGNNQYAGWSDGDKAYREMTQAILHSPVHLICTMRSKMAYEQVEEKGRKKIVKLGLEAEFRKGAEYEFDVQLDLTEDHHAIVTKTRFEEIDGAIWDKPGRDKGEIFLKLVNDGAVPMAPEPPPVDPRRAGIVARLQELMGSVYGDQYLDNFWDEHSDELGGSLETASMTAMISVGKKLAAQEARAQRPDPPADHDPVTTPAKPTEAVTPEPFFKDLKPDLYALMTAKLFALAGELWPGDAVKPYAFFAHHKLLTTHPTHGRPSVSYSTEAQISDAIKALEKHKLTKVALTGVKN